MWMLRSEGHFWPRRGPGGTESHSGLGYQLVSDGSCLSLLSRGLLASLPPHSPPPRCLSALSPGWPGACYVARDDLELLTFLPSQR